MRLNVDVVKPQVQEHIQLARQMGASSILVYLNKADMENDLDLLDSIKTELRRQLDACGFDGDGTLFVVGSAENALARYDSEIGEGSIDRLIAENLVFATASASVAHEIEQIVSIPLYV